MHMSTTAFLHMLQQARAQDDLLCRQQVIGGVEAAQGEGGCLACCLLLATRHEVLRQARELRLYAALRVDCRE